MRSQGPDLSLLEQDEVLKVAAAIKAGCEWRRFPGLWLLRQPGEVNALAMVYDDDHRFIQTGKLATLGACLNA
jgi:hypothetical protein